MAGLEWMGDADCLLQHAHSLMLGLVQPAEWKSADLSNLSSIAGNRICAHPAPAASVCALLGRAVLRMPVWRAARWLEMARKPRVVKSVLLTLRRPEFW